MIAFHTDGLKAN